MLIETSNLSKSYSDKKNALNEISFTIGEPGKIYGFIGPNGAGKTTLVRILSTQLHLTTGSVKILGFDIQKEKKQIRKRISVLPQDIQLYTPELTVRQMIFYYLRIRGYTKKYIKDRMVSILEMFDMSSYHDKKIGSLSGGLIRRCYLSLVLGFDADLYFLDEPTVGLDPSAKLFVWATLRKLTRNGKTIILTSHYMEEISQLCSKVLVLDKGRIFLHGNPADIIKEHFNGIINKITIRTDDKPHQEIMELLDRFGEHINIQNEIIFVYTNQTDKLILELSSLGLHFEISPITLEDVAIKLERGL